MATLPQLIATNRSVAFGWVDVQPSTSLPAFVPRMREAHRVGVQRYVDGLKSQLAIAAHQGEAWADFADTLQANAERMRSAEEPFGSLEDRLAALAAMRAAAAELFAVLEPSQRHRAGQLLPLCCLPAAGSA